MTLGWGLLGSLSLARKAVSPPTQSTMQRLFELKNIARVKDATANVVSTSQQHAGMGGDFNQLSGETRPRSLMGHVHISVTSNVASRLRVEFRVDAPMAIVCEGRIINAT